jgi:hypothetical protein
MEESELAANHLKGATDALGHVRVKLQALREEVWVAMRRAHDAETNLNTVRGHAQAALEDYRAGEDNARRALAIVNTLLRPSADAGLSNFAALGLREAKAYLEAPRGVRVTPGKTLATSSKFVKTVGADIAATLETLPDRPGRAVCGFQPANRSYGPCTRPLDQPGGFYIWHDGPCAHPLVKIPFMRADEEAPGPTP